MYEGFEDELTVIKKQLARHSINYESRHLKRWIYGAWENKAAIAKLIGVGTDYRRELELDDAVDVSDEPLYQHIVQHLRDSGVNLSATDDEMSVALASGKLRSKDRTVRVGKELCRIGKPHATAWTKLAVERDQYHCDSYHSSEPCNCQSYKPLPWNWEGAVSALVELGKGGKVRACATLNPLDFLLASEYCDWVSCVRMEGEYANTTLAYGNDNFTGMLYTVGANSASNPFPRRKLGRAWFYLPEPHNRLLTGRVFGNISPLAIRAASKAITETVSKSKGWTTRWLATRTPSISSRLAKNSSDDGGCVYFDSAVSRLSCHELARNEAPQLELSDATCLMCGDTTDAKQKLACEDCSDTRRCENCDTPVGDEYSTYGNSIYCNDCWSESYFNCYFCSEDFPNDESHEGTRGQTCCESCFYERFFQCHSCGETGANDHRFMSNDDDDYCSDCWSERFFNCDTCSDDYEVRERSEDNPEICKDCAAEAAKKEAEEEAKSPMLPNLIHEPPEQRAEEVPCLIATPASPEPEPFEIPF